MTLIVYKGKFSNEEKSITYSVGERSALDFFKCRYPTLTVLRYYSF